MSTAANTAPSETPAQPLTKAKPAVPAKPFTQESASAVAAAKKPAPKSAPKPATDSTAAPAPEPVPDITSAPMPVRRPRSWSTRALVLSGLLIVVLPTILAAVYYGRYASAQYATGGSYIVKTAGGTPQVKGGAGALAMLGLGAHLNTAHPEMMVVNEYITSMQIIKDLEPLVNLRQLYSSPQIDWLARLKPAYGLTEISDEELWEYWKTKVGVYFDITTGLSKFEVRAFSAADAKLVGDSILKLSEALVNRLSDRAQEDSLAIARKEVESFREKAMQSLNDLQEFQHQVKQVNPEGYVLARSEIEGALEQQLTQTQSQLDILRKNLPDAAPGVQQLQNRLTTLTTQLKQEREKSTIPLNGESAAEVLNQFAKLKLEIDFCKEAYMSSLASLESARMEAAKQGLYLESFVQPQLPQQAQYPRRVASTVLVFVVSLIVWGILGLLVSITREHL